MALWLSAAGRRPRLNGEFRQHSVMGAEQDDQTQVGEPAAVPAEQTDRLKVQIDYAWGWFEYHAGQRFAAFNFFLILVGAAIVGYANAAGGHLPEVGVGIGLIGFIASVAFIVLDIRNRQLVDVGRNALRALEPAIETRLLLTELAKGTRRVRHSWVFTRLIGVFAVVAFVAALYPIFGGFDKPKSVKRHKHQTPAVSTRPPSRPSSGPRMGHRHDGRTHPRRSAGRR